MRSNPRNLYIYQKCIYFSRCIECIIQEINFLYWNPSYYLRNNNVHIFTFTIPQESILYFTLLYVKGYINIIFRHICAGQHNHHNNNNSNHMRAQCATKSYRIVQQNTSNQWNLRLKVTTPYYTLMVFNIITSFLFFFVKHKYLASSQFD